MLLLRFRMCEGIRVIILGASRPLGGDFGMRYVGFSVFVMKEFCKRIELL